MYRSVPQYYTRYLYQLQYFHMLPVVFNALEHAIASRRLSFPFLAGVQKWRAVVSKSSWQLRECTTALELALYNVPPPDFGGDAEGAERVAPGALDDPSVEERPSFSAFTAMVGCPSVPELDSAFRLCPQPPPRPPPPPLPLPSRVGVVAVVCPYRCGCNCELYFVYPFAHTKPDN